MRLHHSFPHSILRHAILIFIFISVHFPCVIYATSNKTTIDSRIGPYVTKYFAYNSQRLFLSSTRTQFYDPKIQGHLDNLTHSISAASSEDAQRIIPLLPTFDELWVPLQGFPLWLYGNAVILHPQLLLFYKYVNLCDPIFQQFVFQEYGYQNCSFYFQSNWTRVDIRNQHFLFNMCIYCNNLASASRDSVYSLQNFETASRGLVSAIKTQCGLRGVPVLSRSLTQLPPSYPPNFLLPSQQRNNTLPYYNAYACYCLDFESYFYRCNDLEEDLLLPIFYFVKQPLNILATAIFLFLLAIGLCIPKCYHTVKTVITGNRNYKLVILENKARKTVELDSMDSIHQDVHHGKQCRPKLFFYEIFNQRTLGLGFVVVSVILLLLEECFSIYSPNNGIISTYYPFNGMLAFLSVICILCAVLSMLNIWIKAIVNGLFLKAEPKGVLVARFFFNILFYLVLLLSIIIAAFVGPSLNATQFTFGVVFVIGIVIFMFLFAVYFLFGVLIFYSLRKHRKSITLCNVKFTKFLILIEVSTLLMTIACIISAIRYMSTDLILGLFVSHYQYWFVTVCLVLLQISMMYGLFDPREFLQCFGFLWPAISTGLFLQHQQQWRTKQKRMQEFSDLEGKLQQQQQSQQVQEFQLETQINSSPPIPILSNATSQLPSTATSAETNTTTTTTAMLTSAHSQMRGEQIDEDRLSEDSIEVEIPPPAPTLGPMTHPFQQRKRTESPTSPVVTTTTNSLPIEVKPITTNTTTTTSSSNSNTSLLNSQKSKSSKAIGSIVGIVVPIPSPRQIQVSKQLFMQSVTNSFQKSLSQQSNLGGAEEKSNQISSFDLIGNDDDATDSKHNSMTFVSHKREKSDLPVTDITELNLDEEEVEEIDLPSPSSGMPITPQLLYPSIVHYQTGNSSKRSSASSMIVPSRRSKELDHNEEDACKSE